MNAERLRDLARHARGDDVLVPREIRIDGAGRIADEAGQMNDGRSVAHRGGQLRNVGDVTFDELEVRIAGERRQRASSRT